LCFLFGMGLVFGGGRGIMVEGCVLVTVRLMLCWCLCGTRSGKWYSCNDGWVLIYI